MVMPFNFRSRKPRTNIRQSDGLLSNNKAFVLPVDSMKDYAGMTRGTRRVGTAAYALGQRPPSIVTTYEESPLTEEIELVYKSMPSGKEKLQVAILKTIPEGTPTKTRELARPRSHQRPARESSSRRGEVREEHCKETPLRGSGRVTRGLENTRRDQSDGRRDVPEERVSRHSSRISAERLEAIQEAANDSGGSWEEEEEDGGSWSSDDSASTDDDESRLFKSSYHVDSSRRRKLCHSERPILPNRSKQHAKRMLMSIGRHDSTKHRNWY